MILKNNNYIIFILWFTIFTIRTNISLGTKHQFKTHKPIKQNTILKKQFYTLSPKILWKKIKIIQNHYPQLYFSMVITIVQILNIIILSQNNSLSNFLIRHVKFLYQTYELDEYNIPIIKGRITFILTIFNLLIILSNMENKCENHRTIYKKSFFIYSILNLILIIFFLVPFTFLYQQLSYDTFNNALGIISLILLKLFIWSNGFHNYINNEYKTFIKSTDEFS